LEKSDIDNEELHINIMIGGITESDKLNMLGNEVSGAVQFEENKTGFALTTQEFQEVMKTTKKVVINGYDVYDEAENIEDQVKLVEAYNDKFDTEHK